MYQIIGNVYRDKHGHLDGFVWVRTNEKQEDLWKYSQHGHFETLEHAEKRVQAINNDLCLIYDKI